MKMKSILMTALLASALLLAGCHNTGSKVKSSELDSVITEESSESLTSESSSSEEPIEDQWILVEDTDFATAIAASQTKTAPYTSCIANGYIGGDQGYTISNVEFTKNSAGKFVTDDTTEGGRYISNFVNLKITDLDYYHMGDGGKYIEPILHGSLFGKMKVTVIDNEALTIVIFDEYGYLTFLGGGTADEETLVSQVTLEWK